MKGSSAIRLALNVNVSVSPGWYHMLWPVKLLARQFEGDVKCRWGLLWDGTPQSCAPHGVPPLLGGLAPSALSGAPCRSAPGGIQLLARGVPEPPHSSALSHQLPDCQNADFHSIPDVSSMSFSLASLCVQLGDTASQFLQGGGWGVVVFLCFTLMQHSPHCSWPYLLFLTFQDPLWNL